MLFTRTYLPLRTFDLPYGKLGHLVSARTLNFTARLGDARKMHDYDYRSVISTYPHAWRSVITENGDNSNRKHFRAGGKLQIAKLGRNVGREKKRKKETGQD